MLFDLDGTFADTLPDLAQALNLALEEAGRPARNPDQLRPLISGGGLTMIRNALGEEANAGFAERVHSRFLELYRANIAVHTTVFPGIELVIETIEARSMKWGIVTNKLARFTEPLMRELGYHDRAGCIVSGDSAPLAKPHPDPLLLAAREIGCQPESCLYVGDAHRDVEAGRRAGMRTLAARYGYLTGGDDPDGWPADGVIDRPEAIVEWLDRLHPESGEP